MKYQGFGKNYGNGFVYIGEYKDDDKYNGKYFWLKQDSSYAEFEYKNGKKEEMPSRMGV